MKGKKIKGLGKISSNRVEKGGMVSRKPIIGILTGGGDVPGLNTVIKSVVYRATELGYEVLGIRRGWMGTVNMRRDLKGYDPEFIVSLDRLNTRTIDRTGGTILHTSRTNPSKIRLQSLPAHFKKIVGSLRSVRTDLFDLTDQVLENLQSLKIQFLVVIGGDDTLSYASMLNQRGFPLIAIPKTMDNDVQNTEYCIGFTTAVTRASDAIDRQRTTVGSHERIGIFRVFGRDAGFTALYTAYVTSIRCLIPEHPFDLNKLVHLLMEDKKKNPSNYALAIISEGAVWKGRKVQEYGEADAYGHKKKVSIGEVLSTEIKRLTGEETLVSDLTYDLRSGTPDFMDKLIATTFGNIAVDSISDGETGHMTAIQEGKFAMVDLPKPNMGPRKVDVKNLYSTDRYRPKFSGKLGFPLFLDRL